MVSLSIPKLEDYSISPRTGFLPDDPPLTHLTNLYYSPWEETISELHALILSRKLRQVVNQLPILSSRHLENEAEFRRAYVLLSFLSHSYIWGDEIASETLPQSLSIPYLEVTAILEVPPVASYAAVCLWNFRPLFYPDHLDHLDNLATIQTFTGSLDESWFYLVSVAIEARGATVLPHLLEAIRLAREDNVEAVTLRLQFFAERLADLTDLLGRMYESCDPYIFYTRIRPFLAGSKNMSEAGLPHGVKYEDGSGTEVYRQYSGGSNAQSSLIQAFDIVLGVEHRPTGDRQPILKDSLPRPVSQDRPTTHNFILEMREYMPGPHRRFLEQLSATANIRNFVGSNSSNRALTVAYDACLHMLRGFRDKHIQIVSRYIIIPAKESRKAIDNFRTPEYAKPASDGPIIATNAIASYVPPTKRQGLAQPRRKKSDLRGTGGTALIPFLKQARDETGEPSIGAWARRLLTNTNPLIQTDSENVKIQGLACQWLDSEDIGGLCHW